MSNAGGFKSLNRYYDMLAGNTTWNPWSPTGAYDALATVTVGGTNVSTIDFVGIPTGYKHLQLRYNQRTNTGGVINTTMTFNGDTAANYSWHGLYGDGTSALALGAASSSNVFTGVASSTATTFSVGVIDILDYANTNKFKTVRTLCGADWNGSGYSVMYSGNWRSTNAVTSISFAFANAATQYTTYALFGVK